MLKKKFKTNSLLKSLKQKKYLNFNKFLIERLNKQKKLIKTIPSKNYDDLDIKNPIKIFKNFFNNNKKINKVNNNNNKKINKVNNNNNKKINKVNNNNNKKINKFIFEINAIKDKTYRIKSNLLRLYNRNIYLNTNLRLEENILKTQKGRLLNNDWNRLKYIRKKFIKARRLFELSLLYNRKLKFEKKNSYNIFLRKTRLNTFITLTNNFGEVILSRSAGWCGIHTKKKKKSSDAFNSICEKFANDCKLKKNINNINYFFSSEKNNFYILRQMCNIFFKLNLTINNFIFFHSKPHSNNIKLRKLRRI